MTDQDKLNMPAPAHADDAPGKGAKKKKRPKALPPETGGPEGPEPTRYGDWERKGIAVDF